MKKFLNGTYDTSLIGKKYNKLKIMEFAYFKKDSRGSNRKYWKCLCDCGNYCVVEQNHIKGGVTKSCGCLRFGRITYFKHGENLTRLHRTWVQMRRRCREKKYDQYNRYAKRGTKVCDEWQEYIPFRDWALANGYDDTLSIDRIDNDGDYTPENCRWADIKTQANNRSSNHLLTYKGVTKTTSQWAESSGLLLETLLERLKRGWSVEDAIFKPVKNKT